MDGQAEPAQSGVQFEKFDLLSQQTIQGVGQIDKEPRIPLSSAERHWRCSLMMSLCQFYNVI